MWEGGGKCIVRRMAVPPVLGWSQPRAELPKPRAEPPGILKTSGERQLEPLAAGATSWTRRRTTGRQDVCRRTSIAQASHLLRCFAMDQVGKVCLCTKSNLMRCFAVNQVHKGNAPNLCVCPLKNCFGTCGKVGERRRGRGALCEACA